MSVARGVLFGASMLFAECFAYSDRQLASIDNPALLHLSSLSYSIAFQLQKRYFQVMVIWNAATPVLGGTTTFFRPC